ncbi:two-component system, NtrC family, nitrogen regulation response regulator NtrX [Enhydrobacter aerosaccus]|uniref:Two-component system, NtrC family, nitrogen regulation response regulator NtrX n=1 Tax=Enhydrobacter aerosaccus TaxID=225324 RepID=A0A1T4L1H8_9HYPH|nr:sigma-54 dependent transcriptional regulator [Enhydrobacter aerosaccus]SJZ48546.1 two-component system, NtrC family, nitrogen regulation response regulator NtrX [Enhydrobacter aerosaccus]
MGHDILIVDDERDICSLIAGILEDEGHTARRAHNSTEAIEAIRQRRPAMVILDVWLQGSELDGLQLLEVIRREDPPIPVVMISGHGTIDTAVSAIKSGAYDFIEKPFKADRLLLVVDRAIEADRLKRENATLRRRAGGEVSFVGTSVTASNVRSQIDRVAPTGSRVLIAGPSGVGKETVARLIHQGSKRAEGPFVVVNCSTLPAERLEIELFGTDGETDQDTLRVSGAFELAHGGTLLLKEVADLPLGLQSRLARVLQEQSYLRDAGRTRVEVDVRVLASSAQTLQDRIAEGQFREELFHRLNVVSLRVPPLSERREDIPELAMDLLKRLADATGLPMRTLGEDTSAALQGHDWPGNVRQLRNVIERLLILAPADGGPIRADVLPNDVSEDAPSVLRWEKGGEIMQLPLRDAREVFEREYLLAQVTRFGGNISRTATFVGMERSALHRKLKSLGLHGATGDERTGAEPAA